MEGQAGMSMQLDPFGVPLPTNLSQNVNHAKIIKESISTETTPPLQHDSSQESVDDVSHQHHIHQIVSTNYV